MIYSLVHALAGFALRLFYRLEVRQTQPLPNGALLFIGNHPNGLVDPAVLFAITQRRITFLAKAPLFRMPIIGCLIRGMGALPVFRRQDDPTRMGGNEATLEAAAQVLVQGGALTIFPEGKSHSEPQLAALKTGAARLALMAQARGAQVTVIPVGLTYAQKHRFRSEALVELGAPLPLSQVVAAETPEGDPAAVRTLTHAMADALRAVTLNLESWEDLPLVRLAESLWALHRGTEPGDPERHRRFARGLSIFRDERPEDFDDLRSALLDFGRRLSVLDVDPQGLGTRYRPWGVLRFTLESLVTLLVGLPVAAVGWLVFAPPFLFVRSVVALLRPSVDVVATYKLIGSMVLFPLWTTAVAVGMWMWGGPWWALGWLLCALPLALFSRHALEVFQTRLDDAALFFRLGSRKALRTQLMKEGDALAAAVEAEAVRYLARVAPEEAGATPEAGTQGEPSSG